MREKRHLLYLGSLWEVIRLVALFSLSSFLANPTGRGAFILILLWLNLPLLVLPLLYFLAAFDPSRVTHFRPVLIFGKILQLFPLLLFFLYVALVPGIKFDRPIGGGIGVPLSIGGIDLLFLLLLIFYSRIQES